MFRFVGPVLTSKSWLNRAQIIHYFNPHLKLQVDAESDDVVSLQNAISELRGYQKENRIGNEVLTFDLGLGGTSFRFFVFLISRLNGEFIIKAHNRLLQRPQAELVSILQQLGVKAKLTAEHLYLKSEGWKSTETLFCNGEESSQFVTGLLLSSWHLNFELKIQIKKPLASLDYLKMTTSLLQQSGMNLKMQDSEAYFQIEVPAGQKTHLHEFKNELDISSAFSLCAAAVVAGQAHITNWAMASAQPDKAFLAAFRKMNIHCDINGADLKIAKHNTWNSLSADLQNCPDLFPVLSVLCALGRGESKLYGAEQLRHKESDRITKTKELLNLAGFQVEELTDGLKIHGQSSVQDMAQPFTFSPDHDHRMAMAAALLKLKGYNIEITDRDVVNKSYPNFWKDIGL